jgi:hypothetical protein
MTTSSLSSSAPLSRVAMVAVAALVLVGLGAEPARAIRFKHPVLMQVTFNTVGDVQRPRLRSERPEAITFLSTGDVLGPGTATAASEIYHWERSSGLLQRITTSVNGVSYDHTRPTDTTQTSRPEYVAFVSTADLDPFGNNADGNPEIFVWEKLSGRIRQITDTLAPVVNAKPFASDSGKCIVFTSTGDLNDNDGSYDGGSNPPTGFTNTDGSQEVFYVELDVNVEPQRGSYTQLTSGPAGSTSDEPYVGGYYYPRQCNIVAFSSDYPQTGNALGGTQLYNFKRISADVRPLAARQVPYPSNLPPAGDYFTPSISSASNFARGPFIMFSTTADVLNNGSSRMNIFRYRVFHPMMTQYTDLDAGEAIAPVISDGGRWIAFESNGEILSRDHETPGPYNPDGNWEIFRLRGLRRVQQITQTTGCENSQATILDKGVTLAFRSTCDLIEGLNPAGMPQVFLYMQVPSGDPLATAAACKMTAGCCNEANGCYNTLEGRKFRVSKPNCLARPGGCD